MTGSGAPEGPADAQPAAPVTGGLDLLGDPVLLLDQMLQLAQVGGWRLDLASGSVEPRAAWCHLHDVSPGDLTLECWLGLVHAEDRSGLRRAIDQTLAQGTTLSARYRLPHPEGGAPRSIELIGRVCRDQDGRTAALFGTALDVTERVRMGEALKDSKEHLRLALRLSRTGVWDWNPATGQVRWFEGTEALWGLPPGVFRGTHEDLVSMIHPQDLLAWKADVSACVEQGTEHNLEFRIIWPDGSVRWLGSYGNAVRDAAGKAVRVAGVVRDITRLKQAEDEQSRFFSLSLHLFLIADGAGAIQRINPAWTEILGYGKDALVGRSFFDLLAPADVEATRAEFMAVADGRDSRCFATRIRCADGRIRTLVWSATGQPESGLVYATGQDITARRESETQLLHAAVRYRELIDHMNDGVWVYRALDGGEDFALVSLNPAAAEIAGVRAEQVEGHRVREVFPGLAGSGVFDVLRRVHRTARAEAVPMARYVDAQRDHWIEGHVYKLPCGDLVGVFADVTQRKLAEQTVRDAHARLESLAYYDQLTGLPNRRLLLDRLQQAIAVAEREHSHLAICYLDLDDFKPVNDRLGHEVGDALLRAVAEQLAASVRPGDTVARWGGDEFALLLTDITNLEVCAQTLDRVLRNLSERKLIAPQTTPISASIGVTLYPRDHCDADTLLRHADHAMYLAKQRGRNNYQFFDPDEDRLVAANRALLRGIAKAIDTHELRLLYQPIVNMRTGAVEALEALVRWQHAQRGLLPPTDFIPSIEGIELARRLDRWVLRQALAQQARWIASGLRLRLLINLSAHSLMRPELMQEVLALIGEHPGVQARDIAFEITETAALDDLEVVSSVIRQAELLGIDFALDDFGTGYSSLTYFRRLPARVLKIDRSFVRDMLNNREDRDIVEGVIGLARAFGREVIAEGVESLEHGRLLMQLGCERAQGYGIAHPMQPNAVLDWVRGYSQPVAWRSPDRDEVPGPGDQP
ncbi:sensor domain-containing protein [Thiocystis violacea]|uniref:sensor domain-containing protein n=1 Tax=Thiocystis violacea TaxID=13725 RepID=UPI0019057600|nr:EAL domain-containing protein [Thiocystis violacea]